jgi:hypothetical protein
VFETEYEVHMCVYIHIYTSAYIYIYIYIYIYKLKRRVTNNWGKLYNKESHYLFTDYLTTLSQ